MPAKKQITKEKILNAALELLKRDGTDAVNIKALAKELHCSTQPVYLSFEGMDELRKSLVPLAVHEFEEHIKKKSEDGKVRLYGMEYIDFAQKEPNLFRFLFMRSNAFEEMKQMLLSIIEPSIQELMKKYDITYEKADYLHDHLWMHTHGIASMIATDFCDWDMEKVKYMLKECEKAFTKKYEVDHVYE